MSMQNNKNFVQIRGTVRYAVKTDKVFTTSIVTRNPVTGQVDVPRAVAFDKLDHYADVCKVGARVTVIGFIQTSKKYPDPTITITDIVPERDRLSARFENEEYLPDLNEVLLEGVLAAAPRVSSSPDRFFARMTICIPDDTGRTYFVPVSCHGKSSVRIAKGKNAGDTVRALCYMQTFTKFNEENVKTVQQRLVAQNIK